MIFSVKPGANLDLSIIRDFIKFLPVFMTFFMSIIFGWFWSITIGLQEKIPENAKIEITKFKIFFFIPLIYILIFSIYHGSMIDGLMENTTQSNGLMRISPAIIGPLHLFSTFCIFYIIYFVTKTIKTVELQRQVSFSDFSGDFFMIWLYPIGIWTIQPRVNKIIE